MKISIQSASDLRKFQRRLFFYRSFFCYFVVFHDDHSCLPITKIITALNLKNKKKRITYIYDTLCEDIDHYYCKKNLCDFKNNQCLIQRRNRRFDNGCCRRCQYVSSSGCTTSNFACKMFYCHSAIEKTTPLTYDDLPLLRCLSIRQRFLLKSDYFSSREDVINDLWWESLFINLFRIYPRFILNIVLQIRKKTQ